MCAVLLMSDRRVPARHDYSDPCRKNIDAVYKRGKCRTIMFVCGVINASPSHSSELPAASPQNVSYRLREPTTLKRKATWREGTWL